MCCVLGNLTEVARKTSIFWDIATSIAVKINGRYGGIYRLHPQGRRLNQTKNQHEEVCRHSLSYFSTLKMEAKCSCNFHRSVL
jgi:hypothetical protein